MTRNKALLIVPILLAAGLIAGWSSSVARAPEPAKVATVDTLALVQRMLNTDAFAPAREALSEELSGNLEAIQEELRQMQGELEQLDQGSARFAELRQRFQTRIGDLENAGQNAQDRFEQMSALQVVEAYKTVRENAVRIAKDMGYSHLLASRTDDDISAVGGVATVTQDMLARPVLMQPEGDDITQAVRTAMNLPENIEPAPLPGGEG